MLRVRARHPGPGERRKGNATSTTIPILEGVGLFLLCVAITIDGLNGLAGSSLRTVLGTPAATPLSEVFRSAAPGSLKKRLAACAAEGRARFTL